MMRYPCMVLAVLLLAGSMLTAAEPSGDKPAPSRASGSLDDELLKGLGDDPLDDLVPKAPPERGGEGPQRRGMSDLDEQLLRGLGGEDVGQPGEDADNPLVRLGRQMRQAEQRIRDTDSGDATQQLQQQIVRDLESLIKQIEQQQRKSSSSSQQASRQQTSSRSQVQQPQQQQTGAASSSRNSRQPARDSSDREDAGQAERPDPAQVEALLKDVWGELPERMREQMLQSSIEQLLPKYELLIEEYFKSLVKQRQERR